MFFVMLYRYQAKGRVKDVSEADQAYQSRDGFEAQRLRLPLSNRKRHAASSRPGKATEKVD